MTQATLTPAIAAAAGSGVLMNFVYTWWHFIAFFFAAIIMYLVVRKTKI